MRIVRLPVEGAVHHIIVRFIDRDFLVNDEASRERYLQLLGRAMSESDWRCLAFAIMSNHIHLAMLAGETPAERWSRRVHPPFASWINGRLERIGPMLADTHMWTVRSENVRRLVAYIHNNPVRARLVAHARESSWTSHRAYLGLMQFSWLDTQFGLDMLRLTPDEFDAYVDENVGYEPKPGALDGIHRAARRRGGIELATPVESESPEVPLVARRFAHIRPDPRRVLELVAEIIGVSVARMRSRERDPASIDARALAIQCGRALGLSISSMTSALGISVQRGTELARRTLPGSVASGAAVVCSRIEGELLRILTNQKGS